MSIKQLFLLLITGVLLVLTGPAPAQETADARYRLAAGDVIRITVFGEPDMSVDEVRLTDAGTFSFPFVGEVRARGRTASELEGVLTELLRGDYLVDPRVTVAVLKYREFFISGEVTRPAGYPYQAGLTVRRAVALAGGLTERASERRITIIREDDPSATPQRANMDTEVHPGDTITIGQGFF